jgi:hypothetical protein
MPISTAVITAALLAGPAASPADPVPVEHKSVTAKADRNDRNDRPKAHDRKGAHYAGHELGIRPEAPSVPADTTGTTENPDSTSDADSFSSESSFQKSTSWSSDPNANRPSGVKAKDSSAGKFAHEGRNPKKGAKSAQAPALKNDEDAVMHAQAPSVKTPSVKAPSLKAPAKPDSAEVAKPDSAEVAKPGQAPAQAPSGKTAPELAVAPKASEVKAPQTLEAPVTKDVQAEPVTGKNVAAEAKAPDAEDGTGAATLQAPVSGSAPRDVIINPAAGTMPLNGSAYALPLGPGVQRARSGVAHAHHAHHVRHSNAHLAHQGHAKKHDASHDEA